MSAEATKDENTSGAEEQENANDETLANIEVDKVFEQIKAGDDALNKLKVQNLDFILDIPLKVTVELGRSQVFVKDLLQFGQGSVVELDKLAGEPLEILVVRNVRAKQGHRSD